MPYNVPSHINYGQNGRFPYNNGFKLSLYTVLDYLLGFKMIVRLGRHFTVNIFPENLDVVLFGKSLTFAQLTFYRFFSLIASRILCKIISVFC